jgi:hypothetical protein
MYSVMMSRIHTIASNQLNGIFSFGPTGVKNIFKAIVPSFGFDRPLMYCQLGTLSDEQQATAADIGLQKEVGKGVYYGSPRVADIGRLMSLKPTNTRFRPTSASMDAYLAYAYALKGMEIFSDVSHQITAGRFATLIGRSIKTSSATETEPPKVGRWDGTESKIGVANSAWMKQTGYDHTVCIEDARITYQNWNNTRTIVAPIITNVSKKPGQFFRYFAGMNTPDKGIISHVFGSLFIQSLSTEEDNCGAIWTRLKSGFRQLATLKAGMALSHAYYGIELARNNCLAISFVVISNIYHGFILHGDFKVHLYGTVTTTKDVMELNEELHDISKHDIALANLVAYIRKAMQVVEKEEAKVKYDITVEDVDSSRKLANFLYLIDRSFFIDFEEKMIGFFEDISFASDYAIPKQESITDVLNFVRTGDLSLLNKYSSVLSRRTLSTDRLIFALQIFFGKVPSVNYGDDAKYTISFTSNDGNITPGPSGKRPLAFLPFKLETVEVATIQWQRLFKSGIIGIPAGRKGKTEFTDTRQVAFKIGGDAEFLAFYGLIKDIVKKTKETGPVKRKRDDADEGPSKKKGKGKVSEDALAMDF